jgi:hypothetical protein
MRKSILYTEKISSILGLPTILYKKPSGLSQKKFSVGLSAGFLRDMPINDDRTIAIASGLVSLTIITMKIFYIVGQETVYSIIDSKTVYNKNKFKQLLIDVPIEFRWRTSTYESHKFWRLYGGFKFSYLLYSKSVF